MANLVACDLLIRMVITPRRWLFSAVCVATLVSCGGGQGDVTAGSPSTAAASAESDGAAACEATIALDPPRTVDGSNRIEVSWHGQGFNSFSVLVQRAVGQAFEPVDAVIAGQSAQVSRGPAYRVDFPTARVRVRGCIAANQCVDSNVQPLLDALLAGVIELPPPNAGIDNMGSTVVLSGDGNTLAVEGVAVGVVVNGMSAGVATDHLHLFDRDAQGRWLLRQVLRPSACTGFVAGSTSLDGAGTTLAVSHLPLEGCPP